MYSLRPYQDKAVSAILKEWSEGRRKTLLILPTGCGKTVVFVEVIKRQIEQGNRVLVLAHRGELLEQAASKLKSADIDSAIEKASETAWDTGYKVVIGSIQTLAQNERLGRYSPDFFQTIVVDEAHHCMSDTYQKVLGYFKDVNILGVTATPARGDMKNLGTFFDSKAFEYDIASAIKEGYLSQIRCQMIPLKIDISNVSMMNGDYSVGETGNVLDPYLHQIAHEMIPYCEGHRTVVFLPLIETSRKFVEILNNNGLTAAEINGSSKDRAEILKAFEAGKIDVLCNAMLLTEGWDCPCVDRIVVLRPTKVRSLYQQMIGRGTRLYPGKDHLLVLDFLWLTGKHDLCRPSALLAQDEIHAKKIDKAMQDGMDLIEAAETTEKDAIAERELALAKQLEEARKKKARLVDPIQYAYSVYSDKLINYVPVFAWEQEAPTEKQSKFLMNHGINPDKVETAGHAQILIDDISMRVDASLASPKQINFLEREGFRKVATWSKEAARKMTVRILKNNWQVPNGIIPENYVPPVETEGEGGDVWAKTY